MQKNKISGKVSGYVFLAFMIMIVIIAGTVASTSVAVTLEKADPETTTQQVVSQVPDTETVSQNGFVQ